MTIPFRVKRLTDTAKLPTRENGGDLWDLYADDFDCSSSVHHKQYCYGGADFDYRTYIDSSIEINPQGRILVKTGISVDLPRNYEGKWFFDDYEASSATFDKKEESDSLLGALLLWATPPQKYAVADIRPRSGLALKHGLTVLNSPGTIDNSYRKEIGVILYNAGHEPYTIKKGEKIAQMLIRPLYPSKMEEVKEVEDTGRGGFGSTGY